MVDDAYFDQKYAELDPEKAKAAEAFLRDRFDELEAAAPGSTETIRGLVATHGHEWIHHFGGGHFYFGMQIRNLLRMASFGEEGLGVDNLDDYYVQLVEHALGITN